MGFYKGLVPSLLRVMPQSAVTLMVYEGLVKALSPTIDQGTSEAERSDAGEVTKREGQQRNKTDLTGQIVPLVIADSQAEQ
jgi:hypothetical protein